MEANITLDDRENAIVVPNAATQQFAAFTEERDKWLATPIAHNTTLAKGGYLFTILDATMRDFEATALDIPRGYKLGEPVSKIAYLCRSQQNWTHYPVGEADIIYKKDELFVILLNWNPIRERDYNKAKELLAGGPIYNICLQEIPNKTKGFNPAHTLVVSSQWKSIT